MPDAGYKTIYAVSTDGTTYNAVCLSSADVSRSANLTEITTSCTSNADLDNALKPAIRRLANLRDSGLTLNGPLDGSTEQITTLAEGESVYFRIQITDEADPPAVVSTVFNAPMIVESNDLSLDVTRENQITITLSGNGPVKTTATYA